MVVKDADRMRKPKLPKKIFLRRRIYSGRYRRYRSRRFINRRRR